MRKGAVPRLWDGETVVCLASGPSLTAADVNYVRGRARVIAVNTSYVLAPWCDAVYACDARWWKHHYPTVATLPALKFSLQVPGAKKPDDVWQLRKTGRNGLEHDPSGLRHGHNSGYQTLNLSVHLGASRILLLGYDMGLGVAGKQHWHGSHPWQMASNYNAWIGHFRTLVAPLAKIGVEVINCSVETRLDAFPRMPLREALPEMALEVAS